MKFTKRAKSNPRRRIDDKPAHTLNSAETKTTEVTDWLELHFALFGADSKATELFSTESQRSAFLGSGGYKRILALMDTLPNPKRNDQLVTIASAKGANSVRLPRSVHGALLLEVKAEGVSRNQLCVAKLVAQLQAVA